MSGTPVGVEVHYEVSVWLNHEAELLDHLRWRDWLALLSPDIRYRMPVPVTFRRGEAAPALEMDHFDEDHHSLSKRVERLETDHAWTEDPPSRTRRFVTNIRAYHDSDGLLVFSNLLLFRSRGDVRPAEWVSAERRDFLPRAGAALLLADRLITVDEAVLHTQNLGVFL